MLLNLGPVGRADRLQRAHLRGRHWAVQTKTDQDSDLSLTKRRQDFLQNFSKGQRPGLVGHNQRYTPTF